MIIRAPFAGVVTAKNAQPGEVISPMSSGGFTRTGICTLVDMESLEVEIDVNESYINRVAAGQPVEATLDAYPEWKIPAKVIAIIPTADRQKATVRVRVGFLSLDPRMLPQMGVKVAFRNADEAPTAGAGGSRIIVPKSAIQERDGKQVAWVLKGERVERRAIRVESYGTEEFQVLAGLATGDRLVLDPPTAIVDGTPAREKKP
jgi:RND family efflux transporter MFP subunit